MPKTYVIGESGLNNAVSDVYGVINEWLDRMIAEGKLTEPKNGGPSRGDVGALNGAVREVYLNHMVDRADCR